ncbi:MAG: hypothetical protein AB7V55_06730 [Oscillospiraceae bacterium]
MITATPIDYGYSVYATVPTVPIPDVDAWMTVDDVARILEVSSEQYQQQEAETQLFMENQRLLEHLQRARQVEYVQAQQNMREFLPNFNDPDWMEAQVEQLALTM